MSEPYDERPLSYFLKEIQRQYCRFVKGVALLEIQQECERKEAVEDKQSQETPPTIPPFVNPWTKPPTE